MHDLQTIVDAAFEDRGNVDTGTQGEVRDAVEAALQLLDTGKLRVAEKIEGTSGPGSWKVNEWLKKAVLLSFRPNEMATIPRGTSGST